MCNETYGSHHMQIGKVYRYRDSYYLLIEIMPHVNPQNIYGVFLNLTLAKKILLYLEDDNFVEIEL